MMAPKMAPREPTTATRAQEENIMLVAEGAPKGMHLPVGPLPPPKRQKRKGPNRVALPMPDRVKMAPRILTVKKLAARMR